MKRFCIACVGFSVLCLAFSCGQQAFKRDGGAAQVSGSGTLFVHATSIRFDSNARRLLVPRVC